MTLGLPDVYHQWANSAKAERRITFSRCLEACARALDAATITPPIATKELFEMVLQEWVAPWLVQMFLFWVATAEQERKSPNTVKSRLRTAWS